MRTLQILTDPNNELSRAPKQHFLKAMLTT